MDIDLRKYFTPAAVAKTLAALPPLNTPVMDLIYPESVRTNHPLPVIGVDEITAVIKNVPVVKRGSPAVSIDGGGESITYIEVQPVDTETFIDAAALNNLKLLKEEGIQQYIQNRIDRMRKTVRKTSEALSAQSLTGAISYPMKTKSGWDSYNINFGSTLEYMPAKTWDTATLEEMLLDLINISTLIIEQGFGSKVEFLVGKDVFVKAASKVLALQDGGTVAAKITPDGIQVASFTLRLFSGTYLNPQTGASTATVDAKKICAVAVDAPFAFYYLAIDDIDAGLLPMPFYASPEKKKNPSGIEVVGKSKPLPVPVPKAICWATMLP